MKVILGCSHCLIGVLMVTTSACQSSSSNADLEAQAMCANAADRYNKEMDEDRAGGLPTTVDHKWDGKTRVCLVVVEAKYPHSTERFLALHDGINRKPIETCFTTGGCTGTLGTLSWLEGEHQIRQRMK